MRQKTLGKTIALLLLLAPLLHATNGDNLIAVGTKARGMGGTGIAISHGAESTLVNPALITKVQGTETSFGGTVFMPDIESGFSGFPGSTLYKSDADTSLIPEVSIAHQLTDKWYIGIGIWGTAGMGTDYSQTPLAPYGGNFHMVTNLQLLQFGVPVAYKVNGLSLAIAPILQYGNLDMNYYYAPDNIGSGLAQDFGFGFSLGATYDLSQAGIEGLTLGAVYKSAIDMKYDDQITTATGPFLLTLSDDLEQPIEFGIGLVYTTGAHTFAFDYKNIKWSDAKGYKDFGWKDQDVFAFGYEYSKDNWALRTGYNYADSAVVETKNPRLNFFNLLGFPATSESHYTVGGTYSFSSTFSLDLAYVYSPASSKTFSITGLGMPANFMSTEHTEAGVSFQLNYSF